MRERKNALLSRRGFIAGSAATLAVCSPQSSRAGRKLAAGQVLTKFRRLVT
jgi:hypothetical protein